MKIDAKEDLIEVNERESEIIEEEINNFLDKEEGQNIKSDIELLNDMGFDKKMINKVYILLKPENIERAIDYMTEINEIYQHDFVPSFNSKEKNLCFICKKQKRNHLNFIPEDSLLDIPQIINELKINKIYEIDNDNFSYDECQVCYEEINKEEKNFNQIHCGHLFCTHCWQNYLRTLITEAKVEKIKCM